MYTVKSPFIFRFLIKQAIWKIENSLNEIYLTFDDGPHPGVTEWVLDTLKATEAKATFFLVGENAQKYPAITKRIADEGHGIGNHTWSHQNAWKIPAGEFLQNVKDGHTAIQIASGVEPAYFRPPYGRLSFRTYHQLKHQYKIAMWDVLSGDFDSNASQKKICENVINNSQSGSLIVFHDSLRCEAKLRYSIPKVIEYFTEKGFRFSALPGSTKIELQRTAGSVVGDNIKGLKPSSFYP